jgi:hypothetical protein
MEGIRKIKKTITDIDHKRNLPTFESLVQKEISLAR